MTHAFISDPTLSISRGIPLEDELGLGSLTLAGYLREVTTRFAANEVAVLHLSDRVIRWTYADWWAESLKVAKSLVALGIGKGERVGIICTNRPEYLSTVFGAALAGAVPTPISTFFTATEIDEVLQLAAVSVLLVERHVLKKDFAAILADLDPAIADGAAGDTVVSNRYPYLRHLALIDSEDGLGAIEGQGAFLARGAGVAEAQVLARADAVSPADPGILLFSSGSTGKVKAILSSNRGPCLQLWRWPAWYDLKDAPRVWSANGFFWSGNFCQGFGPALSTGGALVMQRHFDPEEALDLMQRERVTKPIAWPHQWPQLVAAPNYATVDLSSLKYVDCLTPLAAHPTVKTTWRQPDWAYGNTETFTLISLFPANSPDSLTANSHGRPSSGSTIKIVEPLTGKTMPVGERGEIAVKGPTLMMGYLGIPLADTLDDEGFLRTSDGGYLDGEGRLFWEGRLNDIIKTGGANVSPLEIDAVIRDCPGVKLTQTVGVPDHLLGELVVTCIVRHEGAALDEAAVQAWAKQKLASYKIPRRVLFVAEDDLETTGSAKVKTAELRELAAKLLA